MRCAGGRWGGEHFFPPFLQDAAASWEHARDREILEMQSLMTRSAVPTMVALAHSRRRFRLRDKYGVKDDAKFFTQAAVDRAQSTPEDLSKK